MNERENFTGREAYLRSLYIGELMEEVAAERGSTPSALTKKVLKKQERIQSMIINDQGKYMVLGVDIYDHVDWLEAEFDSEEEAISHVRNRTANAEASPNLVGVRWDSNTGEMVRYSETTSRFYAYTPEGNYIDPNPQLPK